jgi:hypothetical protein
MRVTECLCALACLSVPPLSGRRKPVRVTCGRRENLIPAHEVCPSIAILAPCIGLYPYIFKINIGSLPRLRLQLNISWLTCADSFYCTAPPQSIIGGIRSPCATRCFFSFPSLLSRDISMTIACSLSLMFSSIKTCNFIMQFYPAQKYRSASTHTILMMYILHNILLLFRLGQK